MIFATDLASRETYASSRIPWYPPTIPYTWNLCLQPILTIALIQAFIPGLSPPLVRTPILIAEAYVGSQI
jgi:hypothetical protein